MARQAGALSCSTLGSSFVGRSTGTAMARPTFDYLRSGRQSPRRKGPEGRNMTAADPPLASSAARRTTLAFLARIGFGARGLIYLIVATFAAAAVLGLGKEPHGIMDAAQAITGTGLRLVVAAVTGL